MCEVARLPAALFDDKYWSTCITLSRRFLLSQPTHTTSEASKAKGLKSPKKRKREVLDVASGVRAKGSRKEDYANYEEEKPPSEVNYLSEHQFVSRTDNRCVALFEDDRVVKLVKDPNLSAQVLEITVPTGWTEAKASEKKKALGKEAAKSDDPDVGALIQVDKARKEIRKEVVEAALTALGYDFKSEDMTMKGLYNGLSSGCTTNDNGNLFNSKKGNYRRHMVYFTSEGVHVIKRLYSFETLRSWKKWHESHGEKRTYRFHVLRRKKAGSDVDLELEEKSVTLP